MLKYRRRGLCSLVVSLVCHVARATEPESSPTPIELPPIVVTGTRLPVPEDQSPASVTVIDSEDFDQRQIRRVADALREVPGISVVQTGVPGQLTSVFTRGLKSEHTQVLLDGIPINQGLAGLFNFADLTTSGIDRIEVVRGSQSTIYGPRALAGVIQVFTRRGETEPQTELDFEAGSYDTFREMARSAGKIGAFDYSLGASRLDTDNARPNNQYRNSDAVANVGYTGNNFRAGLLATYSLSDLGDPNTIFAPRPFDNFRTERWLIAPNLDWTPVSWWHHRLIVSDDNERQINDPNEDGFTGPTRAVFKRFTIDYQNDLKASDWLTFTSGLFFNDVAAEQQRPLVLFGPTLIHDHSKDRAAFMQATVIPVKDLTLVAGGRLDHFNQFGDVWTYRVAGSYRFAPTGTTIHSSLATGFSPPSSQDKIFGNNFGLEPEKNRGWDLGVEEALFDNRLKFGATYFHNKLSNVIGFDGQFNTLNLGAARTQGVELSLEARPVDELTIKLSYTYLDAEKTSATDISQPQGARLPRRPRNEGSALISYLWRQKLRTTIEGHFVNAREEINFGGPNFDMEDYATVNFAAEYEIDRHCSIYWRVENLTGEHYAEVFGFPALGRAFYGGVRLRF